MTTVTIQKPTDLLQFVDSIKHDFFNEGLQTGLKTRVTFFVEEGPESVITTMLNKPVTDHVHHMNANVVMALDEAIVRIREQDGMQFEDTVIVLSEELQAQDD
jgi:hypothetical protein